MNADLLEGFKCTWKRGAMRIGPLLGAAVLGLLMLAAVPQLQAGDVQGMHGAQRSIMGAQSRMVERSIHMGQRRMVTVHHPEVLEENGLTGISAGDEVEVTRLEDGRLQVRDPDSGKTILLEDEP